MGKGFLIFFGDKSKDNLQKEINKLDARIAKRNTANEKDEAAKAELTKALIECMQSGK